MTTSKLRRAIAAALCLACLVLAVIGGIIVIAGIRLNQK